MNLITPDDFYRTKGKGAKNGIAIPLDSGMPLGVKKNRMRMRFLIIFALYLSMILLGRFSLFHDLPTVVTGGFPQASKEERISNTDNFTTSLVSQPQSLRSRRHNRSLALANRSQRMQEAFDGRPTTANSNDKGGSDPAPPSTQNPTSSEVRFDEGDVIRLPMEGDYHSQITETPLPNACGPTALLIALDYFDIEQSLETVIEKFMFSAQQGGFDPNCSLNPVCTSPGALVQVAQEEYGLLVDAHEGWTFEEIQESIQAGIPVIADIVWRLADEGPAHFVVIYGVDIEGQILYYHDPYDGAEKEASWEQFSAAWDGPLDMGDPLQPQGHRYWGMGITMD